MNQSEIVLYKTEDGAVKIDTIFQNDTIWLTQKKIAELFDVQRPAITKHLKNIFESGELEEQVVSSILEHTTQHGAIEGKTQTKPVKNYNLDAVIYQFENTIYYNRRNLNGRISHTHEYFSLYIS